jgi:hypothetical protein
MPISTRALVNFCHRGGTAARTGIEARRLWEMEERHATGATRGAISTIRQHVNAGGTIAEGMQASHAEVHEKSAKVACELSRQEVRVDPDLWRLLVQFDGVRQVTCQNNLPARLPIVIETTSNFRIDQIEGIDPPLLVWSNDGKHHCHSFGSIP